MSLSKPLKRLAFVIFFLGAISALGACTFSPVYSGRLAEESTLTLAYAKPNNRLEQLVYRELQLRFGAGSTLPTAPLATVTVSSGSVSLARSQTVDPQKPYNATVTATLTIARQDGVEEDPLVLTRSASAGFTTSGQVLADREAQVEATERATIAAAASLRLAVLATLSR